MPPAVIQIQAVLVVVNHAILVADVSVVILVAVVLLLAVVGAILTLQYSNPVKKNKVSHIIMLFFL